MSEHMPFKILIISSEKNESSYLSHIIERYWFNTKNVKNLTSAKSYILLEAYHLIIIADNLILSDEDNLRKFFHFVRKTKCNIPFIFLIKDQSWIQEKIYFDLNKKKFTKFLGKNFDSHELMITIKNLIKSSKISSEKRIVSYKKLKIDLISYKIHYENNALPNLGKKEFKILELLTKNPEKIITREQLRIFVWGENIKIETKTLDVHINKIRKILNHFSQNIKEEEKIKIITLRSIGYTLVQNFTNTKTYKISQ